LTRARGGLSWRSTKTLNAQPDTLSCYLDAQNRKRTDPVEIVVARAAVNVGGDFHSLPVLSTVRIAGPYKIDGPPLCLEFQLSDAGGETLSASSWAIRFPVAPGSESVVPMIYRHYSPRPSSPDNPARQRRQLTGRGYRVRRNIALIVAVISAGAFIGAMSVRERARSKEASTVVLVGAVSGALLCPGALIGALFWHLRRQQA